MVKTISSEKTVGRVASAKLLLVILVVLFFLSGISGLIYQVLWLRLLAQVFGVTVHAATTVLASFMAGLALGSFIAGRMVDRARNPLLWFGVAEMIVGISALATPLAFEGIERLYVNFYPELDSSLFPLTLMRFLLSFAVLIIPTTMMGATLPIIIKSSLLRDEGLGGRVGLLYATNTAGAVVGAALAGFYLIGGIGISASFRLAVAINLFVGITAAIVSPALKRSRAAGNEDASLNEPAIKEPGRSGAAIPERARKLVLVIFALSGFISLALEIIWFRVLVLFLNATTYAFTIMLATVLCGIAAGSYVITPLMRRRIDWLMTLALIELALGIASLLSLTFLAGAYDATEWAAPFVNKIVANRELTLMIVTSFLAIFPATLLMGIAFPVGLHLWAGEGPNVSTEAGKRIGLFYSMNLFGAIMGSIVAGFLLLPGLGSRGSMIALGALSLICGLLLLGVLPPVRRVFTYGSGAICLFLFVAVTIETPDPNEVVLEQRYQGAQVMWSEEGVQTTVSIHQYQDGARSLYLDGLSQASDHSRLVRAHSLIGHLPMLLHPDPKEALVIGLGGGVTAGAVQQHEGVNVDVVELSESVANGAKWFSHVNNDVLNQPNVRLRIGDGRNYLLTTRKKYDVITADIIRPYHAGAGNLYSVEYFQLVRDALKDDGLVLQWINRQSEAQYKLIMRTFLSVFPYATLWSKDSLIIGSKQPLAIDFAALERRLARPETRAILDSLKLEDAASLLALYNAGPEEMQRYVGPGSVLTDDRPVVEYFLSLPRGKRKVKQLNLGGDVERHIKR